MLYFVVLFLFLHFVGIETDLAWQINISDITCGNGLELRVVLNSQCQFYPALFIRHL